MLEDVNGIVCTCDDAGDGLVLTTYRLKKTDWDTAAAAFATNQKSIYTAISAGKITVTDANTQNYFDAFFCNKDSDH